MEGGLGVLGNMAMELAQKQIRRQYMTVFRKVLSVIKSLLVSAISIVPMLGAFGVKVPIQVTQATVAAPLVVSMMDGVEVMLGDGTGEVKKADVIAGTTAAIQVMQQMSTGGQKETFDKIDVTAIPILIDSLAAAANNVNTTVKTE